MRVWMFAGGVEGKQAGQEAPRGWPTGREESRGQLRSPPRLARRRAERRRRDGDWRGRAPHGQSAVLHTDTQRRRLLGPEVRPAEMLSSSPQARKTSPEALAGSVHGLTLEQDARLTLCKETVQVSAYPNTWQIRSLRPSLALETTAAFVSKNMLSTPDIQNPQTTLKL